jgi:hypothetical protein
VVLLLGKDRFQRMSTSYTQAASTLRPGDFDRDGVCDGCEFFQRTDPRNPMDHPEFGARWDTGGFVANAKLFTNRTEPAWLLNDVEWHQPGKRQRVRGWLMIESRPATFPRGFQLRLTPSRRALLGHPGDDPAAPSLVVPVAHDGYFIFDLQMPTHAVNDLPLVSVVIDNAATNESLGNLTVRCVWPQEPLVPTVTKVPPEEWLPEVTADGAEDHPVFLLAWPPVPEPADNVLIEAARDDENADWFPIALRSANEPSCPVRQFLRGPFHPYTGPLKFRVVPICYSPP